MRRKDREMDGNFALNVADNCAYAVMSVIKPDGSPYCVPLSIAREGGNIYFHCAKEGLKLECLKRDNRVCVCCVGNVKPVPGKFTTEYESAVIDGHANEVDDDEEKISALRAICLKYTPDNMEKFDAAIAKSLERTGIWKIHIESITGKCKRADETKKGD